MQVMVTFFTDGLTCDEISNPYNYGVGHRIGGRASIAQVPRPPPKRGESSLQGEAR
jgi:hypothetical protein